MMHECGQFNQHAVIARDRKRMLREAGQSHGDHRLYDGGQGARHVRQGVFFRAAGRFRRFIRLSDRFRMVQHAAVRARHVGWPVLRCEAVDAVRRSGPIGIRRFVASKSVVVKGRIGLSAVIHVGSIGGLSVPQFRVQRAGLQLRLVVLDRFRRRCFRSRVVNEWFVGGRCWIVDIAEHFGRTAGAAAVILRIWRLAAVVRGIEPAVLRRYRIGQRISGGRILQDRSGQRHSTFPVVVCIGRKGRRALPHSSVDTVDRDLIDRLQLLVLVKLKLLDKARLGGSTSASLIGRVFQFESHECVNKVSPHPDGIELDPTGRIGAGIPRAAARKVDPIHLALNARLSARAGFRLTVALRDGDKL